MIAIVDYGMGNLRSVEKAFASLGCRVSVTQDKAVLERAEKIVLPGVGAFADCMKNLKDLHLWEPVRSFAWDALNGGKHFLGICLGMQALFTASEEDGIHSGFGVIPGRVVRFKNDLKVPHMGWNCVRLSQNEMVRKWMKSVEDGSFFYFVHSYYCVPESSNVIVTSTDYGNEFASSIGQGNLFATQFHPEKSQRAGLNFLKNFINLN